jgi:hypothetical protein
MVLLCQGGAEQGHDPVAHHLVDGAFIVVDGFHHSFKYRIEELARVLGIAVGQQLQGPLQVRKKHGNLLALAFQRALGGYDLLGDVLGGVRIRRSKPAGDDQLGCSGPAQRLAALFAKPCANAIGLTTANAF